MKKHIALINLEKYSKRGATKHKEHNNLIITEDSKDRAREY